MSLILQPDALTRNNLKSPLVVPGGHGANGSGCSATIAVSTLHITRVRVIVHMVRLTHDPEAIPSHGVSCVVVELIKRNLKGAEALGVGWTIRNPSRPHPKAEMGSSSTGVVSDLIIWIDNPETGWVDVRIEQAVRHPCEDSKIVLDDVVHLYSILQEKSETLDVESNIVLHNGIADIMEGAGSVVRVMDGITPDIAGVHISSDVEVDGIPLTCKSIERSTFYANLPSNPESLSNTCQLSVTDSCFHQPLVLVLGTEEKTL